ncbi:MAG TPA: fibronectin type III domain-containing protein [Anaerolineales bacterium]|nr:fibronectin type III domain-containing protein [Anaerolineales bacterium]
MHTRKFLNLILSIMIAASFMLSGSVQVSQAMPMGPTDESKVPHYFGPYPNWANSPFTLPDVQVVITSNSGSGAEAVATVGANGAITSITVTNPGHDYSSAKVDIVPLSPTGTGSGAMADATIVKKGAVVAVTVDQPGSGYTAPVVTFSGNGGAAATAYGGVDQVTVTSGGSGYTFPTVDFDLPDAPDGLQAKGHAVCEGDPVGGPYCAPANQGDTVTIESVVVDSPGSGYSFAPGVAIHNGTLYDPISGATLATATTSLSIDSIVLDAFGADYNNPPDVIITDPSGLGATATAVLDNGIISAITLKKPGAGYLTQGGIRKFVDTLPGLTSAGANNLGQYIPLAVPDTTTFLDNPDTPANEGADYYEIGVVEYQEQMHSDLPLTKLRGYVQLETSVVTGSHYALPGGKFGVDQPHFLGPTIIAQRDRPVRITFYNLLPTGTAGDLFLPVDSTIMGSGEAAMGGMYDPVPAAGGDVMDAARNPMCSEYPKPAECFKDNRATLHLHGGNVPWISDGTPHQWVTPAGEGSMWPEGVSVESVPDMVNNPAVPDCSAANDGCQTFYYTNQQSARLMFYHDHSWGITRLNVYAGEAAGYLITDTTEQALFGGTGPYASMGEGIPLVVQDRTFVPDTDQLAWQDPTWDSARWGGYGNFWYHHVYMPAQNPGDPSGMSAFGRWMYGPWFWPPAGDVKHGPIANPYFGKDPEGPDGLRGTADDWTTFLAAPCSLDDPATWQYQEDPFCEPELIPGTPNISVGMEQFNDTPIVNGTAYPTVTLEPKSYRFRVLNAANDRFFNFQWYVADASTASTDLNGLNQVIGGTEVALNAAEVAAAQLDPVVFPTPDTTLSPAGPEWIHFGTESGFLPKPVVVDGQQVTTWITDPTRFDVGNVDQHSLLLAPAERADVIVDFSRFAGQTLILYNDAPAAFPARIPSYDYYTGAPDLSPVGAPTILPGYGPNTRTIMQVKIAGAAAPAFNVSQFQNRFSHKADGSGVFESGQHPIIVGQAAYNSAYGTSFAAGGYCSSPSSTNKCDGYARINQQGGDPFTFDTLKGATSGTWAKLSIPLEPKAIHDEMNSTNFDEFGRMQATLGVEVVPATPGLQNVVMSPYVFPTTELFDTTSLPRADVKVTPIATADDGTQIWKITHNGVDTHPIHFHATDVQLLNRVTWDNIIIPPDATELGWKETVRIAPLEDTIVAMRPAIPTLPFDFPNSVRLLSPMMPDGQAIDLSSIKDGLGLGMSAFAPNGEPIDVYNHYVNFGAEYVYHCHILSHEEMDMMHSVLYTFPPVAPSGLAFDDQTGTLSWTDNSLSETAFGVEKSQDGGISWVEVGRIDRQLFPNTGITTGPESFPGLTWALGDQFRVVAQNTVGDTWDYADPAFNEIVSGGFPTVTATSISEVFVVTPPPAPPAAPSDLTATLEAGPQIRLAWTDNSLDETGFLIQRSTDGVNFADLATVGADTISYVDVAVTAGFTYTYQVAAFNLGGPSAYAVSNSVTVPGPQPPAAPDSMEAVVQQDVPQVDLQWVDNSNDETGFVIERSTDGVTFSPLANVVADVQIYVDLAVFGGYTYTYRVAAFNANGTSAYAESNSVAVDPDATPPAAPSNLSATNVTQTTLTLNWQDNSNNETGFTIQRATNSSFTKGLVTFTINAADVTSYTDSGLKKSTTYYYRVLAFNGFNGGAGPFPWSPTLSVTTLK